MFKSIAFYERLLSQGQITRRTFMARAAALGATTAMASTLATRAVRAAGPKKGGRIRIGLGHGNTVDSLDPASFTNDFTGMIGYTMCNHLTEIGAGGELIPELAEAWEPNADASRWVFKLRQGIEFHDGRPLTARDVVASLNHHRGEETKSAAKPLVEPIREISADGKYVVVVDLEGGNADFPHLLSDYHLPILPAKDEGTIDIDARVGTGAYTLESFEPGVRAFLKRNPKGWRTSTRRRLSPFSTVRLAPTRLAPVKSM